MFNRWEKLLFAPCPECGRQSGENCQSLAKRPQRGSENLPVGSDREMPHHSRIHLSKSKMKELEMEFDAWFADIQTNAWNEFISLFKKQMCEKMENPYWGPKND